MSFGRFPRKARGSHRRHTPGQMNLTEKRYSEYLAAQLLAGLIQFWEFESVTLKIAPDVRWTPDFLVMTNDFTLEFHDTKAGAKQKKKNKETGVMEPTGNYKPRVEDDARIKIIMAAQKWPFLSFCTVWEAGKAGCGIWERKDY